MQHKGHRHSTGFLYFMSFKYKLKVGTKRAFACAIHVSWAWRSTDNLGIAASSDHHKGFRLIWTDIWTDTSQLIRSGAADCQAECLQLQFGRNTNSSATYPFNKIGLSRKREENK